MIAGDPTYDRAQHLAAIKRLPDIELAEEISLARDEEEAGVTTDLFDLLAEAVRRDLVPDLYL